MVKDRIMCSVGWDLVSTSTGLLGAPAVASKMLLSVVCSVLESVISPDLQRRC